MKLGDWWPWYQRILEAFSFSGEEDQRAADILSELLKSRGVQPSEVRRLIEGRKVLVFGAGPSLEKDVEMIEQAGLMDSCILVAADGATSALLDLTGRAPHIVATDLDGKIRDLMKADRRGSYMVVHGHGDNIPALKGYVPRLLRVLGSTQAEPRPHVYNFGGFTDGDRAVFLSEAFDARMIALAGMDLGETVGRYSRLKRRSYEVKLLKLKFCKELLEWFASRSRATLYNLTGAGEEIKGFKRTTPEALASFVKKGLT